MNLCIASKSHNLLKNEFNTDKLFRISGRHSGIITTSSNLIDRSLNLKFVYKLEQSFSIIKDHFIIGEMFWNMHMFNILWNGHYFDDLLFWYLFLKSRINLLWYFLNNKIPLNSTLFLKTLHFISLPLEKSSSFKVTWQMPFTLSINEPREAFRRITEFIPISTCQILCVSIRILFSEQMLSNLRRYFPSVFKNAFCILDSLNRQFWRISKGMFHVNFNQNIICQILVKQHFLWNLRIFQIQEFHIRIFTGISYKTFSHENHFHCSIHMSNEFHMRWCCLCNLKKIWYFEFPVVDSCTVICMWTDLW